jgi:hypothetical protein
MRVTMKRKFGIGAAIYILAMLLSSVEYFFIRFIKMKGWKDGSNCNDNNTYI